METQKAMGTSRVKQEAQANSNSVTMITSPSIYNQKKKVNIFSNKAIIQVEHTFLTSIKTCILAYEGALALTGVIIPIVASLTMAGIYLAHPSSGLFGLNSDFKWFPLISSTIITIAIWLLAALCVSFFTGAEAANSRSYGLLISRLWQLKANLDREDEDNEAITPDKAEPLDGRRNLPALSDAYTCYNDICTMLQRSPVGMLWTLGTGYINAWSLLHHAEEVLIEYQSVEEVIRGAIHDKLAIRVLRLVEKMNCWISCCKL